MSGTVPHPRPRGRWLRREARLLLMALQFLTRVPVPARVGHDAVLMQRAVRHFPLVGAAVGAFGAAVALAALTLWPPFVAALLALAATVWLCAAFHEDGLADTFDALLGAAPRDKALRIMRDSRIGSYGAAALVLVLLLRAVLVAELLARAPVAAAAALVAAHAAARAAAVVLMAWLPYAREDGSAPAGDIARGVRRADAAVAAALGAGFVAAAAGALPSPALHAALALLGLAALVVVMQRWLRRRLGGHTGDTLGATEQFGELLVLLAMAAQVVAS